MIKYPFHVFFFLLTAFIPLEMAELGNLYSTFKDQTEMFTLNYRSIFFAKDLVIEAFLS